MNSSINFLFYFRGPFSLKEFENLVDDLESKEIHFNDFDIIDFYNLKPFKVKKCQKEVFKEILSHYQNIYAVEVEDQKTPKKYKVWYDNEKEAVFIEKNGIISKYIPDEAMKAIEVNGELIGLKYFTNKKNLHDMILPSGALLTDMLMVMSPLRVDVSVIMDENV